MDVHNFGIGISVVCMFFFFFFKQKTAYEIYQCDWSSDVCSSDLIHGFNNFPEGKNQIFERAATMQKMIPARDNVIVIPMIWPCDNDFGVILDYWDDQKSAEASSAGFARVLGLFLKWRDEKTDPSDPCTVRINMLAHSMGNRVLRYALDSWANDYGSVPLIFKNVFLAAADIANESLEADEVGPDIAESARNVVVYHE